MPNRLVFFAALVGATIALVPATRGQVTAPRSSVADISGVWLVAKVQPALFPKGGAPLQPWAAARFNTFNLKRNDPNLACLPEGVPRFMFVPLPMEILQLSTRVVIIHPERLISRALRLAPPSPKWRPRFIALPSAV